jgi:hypothetical protein
VSAAGFRPGTVTQQALASAYTPGDATNQAWQNGSTISPPNVALGQSTSIAHSVPIWGVVVVALLLAFLELRRKHLMGGR